MGAPIDDVHHRNRKYPRRSSPHITIQRHAAGFRRRLGNCQRDTQNGIGPEPRLVGRAVKGNHYTVNGNLILRIHVDQVVKNFAVNGSYRVQYALAAITFLVAIAKLNRLMRAR